MRTSKQNSQFSVSMIFSTRRFTCTRSCLRQLCFFWMAKNLPSFICPNPFAVHYAPYKWKKCDQIGCVCDKRWSFRYYGYDYAHFDVKHKHTYPTKAISSFAQSVDVICCVGGPNRPIASHLKKLSITCRWYGCWLLPLSTFIAACWFCFSHSGPIFQSHLRSHTVHTHTPHMWLTDASYHISQKYHFFHKTLSLVHRTWGKLVARSGKCTSKNIMHTHTFTHTCARTYTAKLCTVKDIAALVA